MGKELHIIQFGLGGVGQALLRQYLQVGDNYPWLSYRALADSSGLFYLDDTLPREAFQAVLDAKATGGNLRDVTAGLLGARFIDAEGGLPSLATLLSENLDAAQVIVDVTARRDAYSAALEARSLGAHVVLCNKWSLAEPQERYDVLMTAGEGMLLYETTVGAALPVIGTLDRLLSTGDEIHSIEAAISGTLGFVTTEIERGVPFSEALRKAQALGYTEPDPRDDLAGVDARRKALILARKLGQRLNMVDIEVETLVPEGLESVTLDEFWAHLPKSDVMYAERVARAEAQGMVLRFLAKIDVAGARVALQEVPKVTLLGSLTGTESLFVFHTARYGEQPLAVRGRGAGADLTASGVLADILSLAT